MSNILKMLARGGAVEPTDPNFNQTVLLLHGDGTNGAQNNTFLDSSTNNFTITRNGNTTQGTFSPFSSEAGKWGVNTGSSGSNGVSIADNAALQMGTGDFTIEGWFWPTATGSIRCFYTKGVNTTGGLIVGCSQSQIFCRHTGTTDLTYAVTMPQGWNHIAWVRSGSTLSIYLNGTSVASATVSFNQNDSSILYVGAPSTLGADANRYYGEASNFRVVKGTALYTTTFTPSTTPLTNISGTSLLVFQSNRFKDNSSNAFAATVFGAPSIQPFSPFAPSAAYSASVNGGSGYFDGTGDYVKYATNNSSVTNWYSQSTTIEAWIYPTSSVTYSNNYPAIVTNASTSSSTNYWAFGINALKLRFAYFNGSGQSVESSGSVSLNAWNHIAFVYDNSDSSIKLYINGTLDGSGSKSGTPQSDSTLGLLTGGWNGGSFAGYISGVRVLTGSAQAPSPIPTSPPTDITNTSFLANFTNAGIFDNTGKNNLETVGNAQIDTTTKKYGTGSMEFDGTGDWLLLANNVNQQLGTGNFTIEFWVYLATGDTGSNRGLVAKGTSTTGFLVSLNTTQKVVFTFTTSTITSSGAITLDAWNHIAVVREGTGSNQTKIYIAGTNDGTGTVSTDFNQTSVMYVGANRTGGDPMKGYIDDLRITKGVARYTSAFTPPTAAFPDL